MELLITLRAISLVELLSNSQCLQTNILMVKMQTSLMIVAMFHLDIINKDKSRRMETIWLVELTP
jgi:hypothetical protein